MDQSLDICTDDEYALVEACSSGHIEKVREFVRSGVNPNFRRRNSESPLHAAAADGQLEVVKVLIDECGADINYLDLFGETALSCCATHPYEGKIDVRDYLLTLNPNIDLVSAVALGYVDRARELIDEDLLNRTRLKDDLLAHAINSGSLELVKLLLNAGLNPNRTDSCSLPIEVAVSSHNVEMVHLLLRRGASPNHTPEAFDSALRGTRISTESPPEIEKMLQDAINQHKLSAD